MSKGIWDAEGTSDVTGKAGHKPSDTDVNSDSPHHTLGKGPTQSAPGNHTHLLVGEPGNGGGGIDLSGSSIYGRNRIINGDFSVNQRGFTSATLSLWFGGFSADRWNTWTSGGSLTISLQQAVSGELPESARQFIRLAVSGQSGSDSTNLQQHIEGVRTLSGKTATVSFWARCASGSSRLSVDLSQEFGSGGSPSGPVLITPAIIKLANNWTRYSITFQVPSLVGKTIGTDGNDRLTLRFLVSQGGQPLGIQSDTFDIWGVQIEEGSYATPYEKKTYAQELRNCQRYFTRLGGDAYTVFGTGIGITATEALITCPLPTTMRAFPVISTVYTLRLTNGAVSMNVTGVIAQSLYGSRTAPVVNATSSGLTVGSFYWLDANGIYAAYLDFNAEL